MVTNLLLFGYFQLLDLLTTVVFILRGVQEANPVVKFALRAAPTPLMGLLFVKLTALALAFYCWRLGRHSLLLRINILFAFLISWNLIAILVRSVDLL